MTLIEGLVGVAVWNLANDNLTRLVLRQPLTEKQLVALDKRLADPVTHAATIERGLANERRFGPSIVDEMCTRPCDHLVRCLAVPPALAVRNGCSMAETRIHRMAGGDWSFASVV